MTDTLRDIEKTVSPRESVSGVVKIILVFALGLLTGFPAATIGVEFLVDNGTTVFVALAAVLLIMVAIVGGVIVNRRRIWGALFRRGEEQVERIAEPLVRVVQLSARQQVGEATEAARELVEMVVAQVSWFVAQRWMVATMVSLLVSIAALAGAALLLQQNQLLRSQGVLLSEQNDRIQAQIQLGEAQRSTSIVPEILSIGAALGEEAAALAIEERQAPELRIAELSRGLRARIVAASTAARPYRHLTSPLSGLNEVEVIAAAVKRRTDLPDTLGGYEDWQARQPLARSLLELGAASDELTDRESSPERGQLISLLYNSGVVDTEALSHDGADFSFAEVRQPTLGPMTFRHAKLSFADFSDVELRGVSFGAARLEHARFHRASVEGGNFSSLTSEEIAPPYSPTPAVPLWLTQMSGADFTGASISQSLFIAVSAPAANFDNSMIVRTDFGSAVLSASTFRGAIIYESTFVGASLESVDFSDAIVFDESFLDQLSESAAEGSFVAARFALESYPVSDLTSHPHAFNAPQDLEDGITNGSLKPWRVVRIGEFESIPRDSDMEFLSSPFAP